MVRWAPKAFRKDALTGPAGRPPGNTPRRRVASCAAVLAFAGAAVVFYAATPAHAVVTTLYVDKANSACSDTGAGSQGVPFCTINKGATVAVAGQTVLVSSGTYSEMVTVAHSGSAGSPITLAPAPGASVTVTGGDRGFYVSGRSWVVVTGFTVTGTVSNGIRVSSASTHVTVSNNHVSLAGQPVSGATSPGIYIGASDTLVTGNVTDHNTDGGIFLAAGANVTVTGNTSFANARGYTRAAPGIDVRSGPNIISYNVVHDNEDSGLQFYPGASGNLVIGNISYLNGDHGIDDLNATNQVIVGNTVYKNVAAGINLEGTSPGSTGGTVVNNVSVDNGIRSPRTSSNIRVDSVSVPGTVVDSNLVFLHSPGTIQYIWQTTGYTSQSAFAAATGQESHGRQGDPLWASPDAADFRLTAGSPAIDSANSGVTGEPATDAAGAGRVDDPSTPDTGLGPRTYDDRGAFEFQP